MLRNLKIKAGKYWDRTSIKKLVKMYKEGPNRSSKIVEQLDVMERHATVR